MEREVKMELVPCMKRLELRLYGKEFLDNIPITYIGMDKNGKLYTFTKRRKENKL